MANRNEDCEMVESMVSSMTGFGKGEREAPWGRVVVEVKSLNHRYLDVAVRSPRELAWVENAVRSRIKERFRRGRVEATISVKWLPESRVKQVTIDNAWYMAYHSSLKELGEKLGISPRYWQLAISFALADAIKDAEPEIDASSVGEAIMGALEEALMRTDEARRAEGSAISRELLDRASRILANLEEISLRAPKVAEEHRTKLRLRLQELLGGVPGIDGAGRLDESRLATEIALMAQACDVSEEISRASAHLNALVGVLGGVSEDELVGRRIEFILQEVLREVNTLSAKANDYEISERAVLIKAELERMREQAQNLA